ncbi:MAG TPA: hypothetical protein VIW03_03070 [Anaeromyxobacter sp.]
MALVLLALTVGYVAGRTSLPAERPPPETRVAVVYEPVPAPAPSGSAQSPGSGATRSPSPSAGISPPPPSADELRQRAVAQAHAELDRVRPRLVERCWHGLPPPSGLRSATLLLDVTFDAQGREVGRAVVGSRADEAALEPVAECVRGVGDLPLSIQPAGTSLGVQLALTLP